MEKFEKLIIFLKENGYVFKSSEIYGGMANFWDFGPVGVALKNKIKNYWWKFFIENETNVVGLDSAIILKPDVWIVSGHLDNFSDPMMDCKNCKNRFRIDHLITHFFPGIDVEGWDVEKLNNFVSENKLQCLKCQKSDFTKVRNFNLMYSLNTSITNEEKVAFLRPETAQGIFLNFNNVVKANNLKLPFGVGQIGKSFRNEITAKNFIFRSREFEQMEIEFFYNPKDSNDFFNIYLKKMEAFLKSVGIDPEKLFKKEHSKEQLSHYSSKTIDFEFGFPFGKKELCGLADRGNFDLKNHNKFAHSKQVFFDSQTNEKIVPFVVEPSFGLERLMLAIIDSCFVEEEDRTYLKFPSIIAPYQIGITPLIKKIHNEKAMKIFDELKELFSCIFIKDGNIGKRYKKFDNWGVPYVITIDDKCLEKNILTIRNRNSKEQIEINYSDLITKMKELLSGNG